MCGILGVIGQEIGKKEFIRALNLQRHRGPDDQGYYQAARVQLGHRRLSIIDIHQQSSQPMVAGGGDVVGVFNGELYNYQELRRSLEAAGYLFVTRSDTEVLLNGYHYYGEELLQLLIGMFTFSIYDKRTKDLFIARDRLGIKPLYYTRNSKHFLFSSEIKSILLLDDKKRNINNQAISAYFSYRYPILNDTFFNGISQLPPGHCMRLNENGHGEPRPYWSLSDYLSQHDSDLGEPFYIEKIQELFKSAVSYRMISDVPIGAYLSGGVDSSAVVAQMAQLSKTPIRTFTIGFAEKDHNEFKYARLIANQYNTDHHELVLSQDDYLSTMMELINYKDAPLGVPNEVALYSMSKELRKHIAVVLSGEGADEIFGGYGRILRSADDYEKITRINATNGQSRSPRLEEKIAAKYSNTVFTDEVDHFLYLYRYTSIETKNEILHPRLVKKHYDHVLDQYFRDLFHQAGDAAYVNKVMYVFEKLHLPGLLQRLDVTTMATSVEARVPFVDHRLVELAFRIPQKYKLKWKGNPEACKDMLGDEISEIYDIPKYILKKAMQPLLPQKILDRPKMGFPVPITQWLGGNFRSIVADHVLGGELVRRDLINQHHVSNFLASKRIESSQSMAKTAWMLLSLELFLKSID